MTILVFHTVQKEYAFLNMKENYAKKCITGKYKINLIQNKYRVFFAVYCKI